MRGNLVLESPMGKVGNPKKDLDVSITHRDIRYGDITFHSHPSGQIIDVQIMPVGQLLEVSPRHSNG